MTTKKPPVPLSAPDSRQFLGAVFALVLGRRAAKSAGHSKTDFTACTDAEAIRIAAEIRAEIQRMYPNLY